LQTNPEANVQAALEFGTALAKAWSSGSVQLGESMSAECSVQTPVWTCSNREAYEKELKESQSFFSPLSAPSLTVLSSRALRDGRVQLSWMLSLEWPAVWRPRLNLLGESTITFTPASGADGAPRVSRVVERWHASPSEVFLSQVLPRWRDLTSLQATPTAEQVPMPVVERCDGYELKRLPPMLALQAETIETGDLLLVEQAPLPPAFAFGGEVKRKDWYNCVSPGMLERSSCVVALPGSMQQTGQRRRWIAPLPARFGVDPDAMPALSLKGVDEEEEDGYLECGMVTAPSLRYVRRPAQLLAVARLGRIPSNELVLSTAVELMNRCERDGRKVIKRNGRPVLVQLSGDVKYGFNDRKELAMTVWLSVPDPLREEYVAVIIDEGEGDGLPGDDA
jgi:hypothetical protein